MCVPWPANGMTHKRLGNKCITRAAAGGTQNNKQSIQMDYKNVQPLADFDWNAIDEKAGKIKQQEAGANDDA